MLRPFALTIPAVTVEFKLNGLPTAKHHSPTFTSSLLAKLIGVKSSASILISAKSVFGSVPMTVAVYSRLSCKVTVISSAPFTTWLLVTM